MMPLRSCGKTGSVWVRGNYKIDSAAAVEMDGHCQCEKVRVVVAQRETRTIRQQETDNNKQPRWWGRGNRNQSCCNIWSKTARLTNQETTTMEMKVSPHSPGRGASPRREHGESRGRRSRTCGRREPSSCCWEGNSRQGEQAEDWPGWATSWAPGWGDPECPVTWCWGAGQVDSGSEYESS